MEEGNGSLASHCRRFWNPTRDMVARLISTQLLCFAAMYLAVWGLLGDDSLPGSEIFAILLLGFLCHVAGHLVTLVKLPPLLGMLIMGFAYRNLPFIKFYENISHKWTASLRNISLAMILLRAGFNLDPVKLRQMSFVCIRLAFIPCMVEALITTVVSHRMMDLPWALSFALGCIISAVSPAVIVSSILPLAEMGYGVDKGVNTLCIASSSVDDLFSIVGFGVCAGVIFAEGNLAWTILKPPVEVLGGVVFGCLLGFLFWIIPHPQDVHKARYHSVLLVFSGLAMMLVGQHVNSVSAGAIGCLCLAFIAGLKWRTDTGPIVNETLLTIWLVGQNFLFGLIGAAVSIQNLKDHSLDIIFIVICIGLLCRMVTCFVVLANSGLNTKEKIFVASAWIPKATVQAALGPVIRDTAILLGFTNYVTYGQQILTTAVLAILITAPLGAIAINYLGRHLLKKSDMSLPLLVQGSSAPYTNEGHDEDYDNLASVSQTSLSLRRRSSSRLSRESSPSIVTLPWRPSMDRTGSSVNALCSPPATTDSDSITILPPTPAAMDSGSSFTTISPPSLSPRSPVRESFPSPTDSRSSSPTRATSQPPVTMMAPLNCVVPMSSRDPSPPTSRSPSPASRAQPTDFTTDSPATHFYPPPSSLARRGLTRRKSVKFARPKEDNP